MKVLKFFTDTCMPCKVVGKVLEKIEDLEVTPVNAGENPAMVDKYNVFMTPTLIFLNEEGKEVERTKGLVNESKIREILAKYK